MNISRRAGGFHWNSSWLFVGIAVIVVAAFMAGIGLAVGAFRPAGQSRPPVAVSPTPIQSASPAQSVVAQLKGRIAISNQQQGGGGWVNFPGGSFTSDPGSNVALTTNGAPWVAGLTQVAAMSRWVPVPREWVSPDGLKYAYADDSGIHVLRAGGAQQLLNPTVGPGARRWELLSVEDSGVYAMSGAYSPFPAGLWWIPYSGSARAITTEGYWSVSDGKYAYGSMNSWLPAHEATSVDRLDMSTGSSTTVFSVDGMRVMSIGLAAGGGVVVLVVNVGTPTTLAQIWLARPDGKTKIYETAVGPQSAFQMFDVEPDTIGTWITTSKGLYLYSGAGWEFASPATGWLGSAFRS